MKKIFQYFLVALLMLGLTACGEKEVEITPTAGVSMDEIHTAVVLTLTEQAAGFTPTPEPTATITPTIFNSPTTAPTTATLPVVPAGSSNITANGCNDAAYVSDVTIPDGTVMAPKQAFTKTWKLSNTGTCNWSTAYKLTFVSGDAMGGKSAVMDEIVNIGVSKSISVDMVAPDKDGTYYGYWRMADANGAVFGGTVYVTIKVSASAATATPTITKTGSTSTNTSTSALTATKTKTVPSATTGPSNTPQPNTVTPEPDTAIPDPSDTPEPDTLTPTPG